MGVEREPTVMFCVGATKAGTTWLYEHLHAHPDCHFRTIKELHYFDTVETGRFKLRLAQHEAEAARVKARLDAAQPEQRRRLTRRLADLRDWITVLARRGENLAAYRDYLMAGRGEARVVGDVTPSYATLGEDRLRAMARVSPEGRFVYLLRDPVARLWSHVRMLARREVADETAYPQAAVARMDGVLGGGDAGVLGRGDYISALKRLDAAVDPSRLMVLFFEDLMTLPGLSRLCDFLGIRVQPAPFEKRVHEGIPLELPAPLADRARALLRPQYDYAASRFGLLPEAWRRNMQEVTP